MKERTYEGALSQIKQILFRTYSQFAFLSKPDALTDLEKKEFLKIKPDMPDTDIAFALNNRRDT